MLPPDGAAALTIALANEHDRAVVVTTTATASRFLPVRY
jgi:hypothetical protein